MTTSLKHRIYRLITDDPSISIDELTSTLDADGDRVSRLTVSSIAGGFRETLKFLHSDGHLIPPPDPLESGSHIKVSFPQRMLAVELRM